MKYTVPVNYSPIIYNIRILSCFHASEAKYFLMRWRFTFSSNILLFINEAFIEDYWHRPLFFRNNVLGLNFSCRTCLEFFASVNTGKNYSVKLDFLFIFCVSSSSFLCSCNWLRVCFYIQLYKINRLILLNKLFQFMITLKCLPHMYITLFPF